MDAKFATPDGLDISAMDNFVRNTLDLTNRVDIKWLMDHFPEYAQRILPQFYTVDELGHTIEVLVTPFGAAIIEGPISVLRYFLRVALRAMRW